MSDSRRNTKPRQLRGKISAGLPDIETFKDFLNDYAAENDWDLTFEDLKRRGDYGPLHDYAFGFVEKL